MIRNRWNSTLRIVLKIGDSIIGEKNGKADLKEILNDRPIEFFFFCRNAWILCKISGDFIFLKFWYEILNQHFVVFFILLDVFFFPASHELDGFFWKCKFHPRVYFHCAIHFSINQYSMLQTIQTRITIACYWSTHFNHECMSTKTAHKLDSTLPQARCIVTRFHRI